ncbi:hypothetical protein CAUPRSCDRAFT_12183, partial [Caulochytrium protostelioides]
KNPPWGNADPLLPIDLLGIKAFEWELDPLDEVNPKLRFSSDFVLFSLFLVGPRELGFYSSKLFPKSDQTWKTGYEIVSHVLNQKQLGRCYDLNRYVLWSETLTTETVWLHENYPVGADKIHLIANFASLLRDYGSAKIENPWYAEGVRSSMDIPWSLSEAVNAAKLSLEKMLKSGQILTTVTDVANSKHVEAKPQTPSPKHDYAFLIKNSYVVYQASQSVAKSISEELIKFSNAELTRRNMHFWTDEEVGACLGSVKRWYNALVWIDALEKHTDVISTIDAYKHHQFPGMSPRSAEEKEQQKPFPNVLTALSEDSLGTALSVEGMSPPAMLTRLTAVVNALAKPAGEPAKSIPFSGISEPIKVTRHALHDYIRGLKF